MFCFLLGNDLIIGTFIKLHVEDFIDETVQKTKKLMFVLM